MGFPDRYHASSKLARVRYTVCRKQRRQFSSPSFLFPSPVLHGRPVDAVRHSTNADGAHSERDSSRHVEESPAYCQAFSGLHPSETQHCRSQGQTGLNKAHIVLLSSVLGQEELTSPQDRYLVSNSGLQNIGDDLLALPSVDE